MREIIADQNLVFIANNISYSVDCSALLADAVVYVGVKNGVMWAEKSPFTGKITNYDFSEAERLFAEADALHVEATREPTEEELLEQWRLSCKVSPFQAEEALANFGMLEAVEQWLATDATDTERRAWARAQEWRYTSPTISAACDALGISAEQKDQLFKHAETIEA
ncbi:hypothetical protein HOP61_19700 [Halomonas daqingensis]|uniref:Uncharacterized protein n=1 Tax=Billgrantia desiderata TaxID=52021 RepID=A0AAW4Z084_9GAMM|nr:hypothetical protein [Halomonas desiderata]MCE8053522.1 hypothetical protein [Halomonas desiderata]